MVSCCMTVSIHSQQINFENFIPVENLPSELLPKKVDEVGFLFSTNYDTCVWGYNRNDVYTPALALGDEFNNFYGTDIIATYEKGIVTFMSRYPYKAAMTVITYSWDGKILMKLKENYFDPSQEAIDSAEAAVLRGDFWAASNFYMQVQYPGSYMNEFGVGIELLQTSHRWSMQANREKNYVAAVNYMQGAMNYFMNEILFRAENQDNYEFTLENNSLSEHKDSLGLWWADYGYFLLMADSFDKCIDINTQLNIIYPQLSGPYLQLGDAHYALGHSKPARSAYEIYVKLMQGKGKENSIPQRVKDRLK